MGIDLDCWFHDGAKFGEETAALVFLYLPLDFRGNLLIFGVPFEGCECSLFEADGQ